MDAAKIRMAGSLVWKPIAGVIALIFLLVLVFWMWQRPSSSMVGGRQMAAVIRQAGHGKVELRQNMDVDGIPAAQVRYPNHSLHTVFFLAHDGKIRGIVVGGHVYTDHGKPWVVAWHGTTYLPTPTAPVEAPAPAVPANAPVLSSIPNPAMQAQIMQKTVGIGSGPADDSPADDSPIHSKTVLRYAAFAHGFVWGRDDHTPIDALVDPNCIYCHKWFASEKAAVNAGKISFRIIPVAALKPSSVPRAIEIMSAKNPLQLWLQSENGFHTKTESGGITTTLPKNKAMQKAAAVNTAILYAVDNHHPFTPTFVDIRTGQVWMGANHDQELAHAFVQK
jgi:protein-disulfide isomerase